MSGSSGTVGTLKGRGSLTISDNHGDNTGGAVAFHYTGNGGYSEIYIENNNTLVLNADPTAAGSNTSIKFRTDNALAAMIDDTQRLLVGPTSALSTAGGAKPRFQVAGSTFEQSSMFIGRGAANSNASGLNFVKSRNANFGGQTILQNNDQAMYIGVYGDDGTDNNTPMASIVAEVDGTPAANDMPGRIRFSTTADGSSGVTERMRITSDGSVLIGIQSSLESIKMVHAIEDATSYDATNIPIASSGLGLINTETTTLGNKTTGITLFAADGTNSAGRAYVGVVGDGFRDGNLVFGTSSASATVTEKMRILDTGEVLIGSTSGTNSITPINLKGAAGGVSGNNFVAGKHGDSNYQPAYTTVRSRGSEASPTSVAVNDGIAAYNSYGYDGSSYIYTGGIQMFVDGTPGTNDMPSRMNFYTVPDGSSAATERMRITNEGKIGVGYTTPSETLGVNGFLGFVGSHGSTPPSANPSIVRIDGLNTMGFFNNSAERLRIETDGHFLFTTDEVKFYQSGSELIDFIMDTNRSGAGQTLGRVRNYWNGNEVARMEGLSGSDTTNKDDGELRFLTRLSGSSIAVAMQIHDDGVVTKNKQPYAAGSYTGSNITATNIIPINTNSSTQGGITITASGTGHKFTVPHGGVYMIGWNHLAGSTGGDRVEVRANGVLIAGGTAQDQTTSSNDSFSSTYVTYLAASDYVQFYCTLGEIHGNASYNRMWIALLG
jgi:hypothetical protein